MKLKGLSQEERKGMSFIEVAQFILEERKEPMSFQELTKEIATILELSESELRSRMLQFYTDLNVEGRFFSLGSNHWGLRKWYPSDQVKEEIVITPKKKRKKKASEEDDELIEDEDDLYDSDDLDEDDEEDNESLEELREEDDDLDADLLDEDFDLEDEDIDFEDEDE